MKWYLSFKKIGMSNLNRIISRKSFENSMCLINRIRNKFDVSGQTSILRLQKIGTLTKIDNNVKDNFLKNKMDGVVKWYEQLTGLDEVRFMQNRVIEAQNRLVQAQENRREATKLLDSVQNKLKDIRAELDTATKGEERYLHLITQEHSILKEERQLSLKFQLCEKEERDCFAFLSSAVKESHEKERAQAERTKYWSVIGSIVGTIIGVLGSSINNEFKMRELRKLVKLSANGHSESVLKLYEKELVSLVNEIRTIANQKQPTKDSIVSDEILLHNLSNHHHETTIEQLLELQRQEIKKTFIISTAVAISVPIICMVIQRLT